MSRLCRWAAGEVEQGQPLEACVSGSPFFPASLAPFIRWGERADNLTEALRIAGDIYEDRARLQADLVKNVLPPIVFLLAATCVMVFMGSILVPIVEIFSALI